VKAVFVSNLFPNANEPARGVFNLHQIRHLAALCDVRVVAPIAWLPFRPPFPAAEEIAGLHVEHPKQFYLPKIGRPLNAWLYARSVAPLLRRLRPFDIIFVNWACPDACGIAQLGYPFVVSISGSDANVGLTFRIRRRQILAMLRAARAVTTRSRALKELLVSHGADAGKIHVLYNGVDREIFTPARLASAPRLVYIGRLSPEKGVADLLAATAQLHEPPPVVIIGDGPQRAALQRQYPATFLGAKHNHEIAPLLRANDIVCLPSHMEGVPNAALEAFACGLPVVGSRVGGIPEIITPQTGILTEPGNPAALAAALREALNRRWNRDEILAHAAKFDWTANARALYDILAA
jgi:glycosyltransferase involved in cell wall biosynthesis